MIVISKITLCSKLELILPFKFDIVDKHKLKGNVNTDLVFQQISLFSWKKEINVHSQILFVKHYKF